MKLVFFFVLVFLNFVTFSQNTLTAEEKAYFYHVVRKSPILDTNIGRYFEYKGPVFVFANKNINYDSIETNIINNPEQLIIRTQEISKAPKGIIAELTNKVALWELNIVLNSKRMKAKDYSLYESKYQKFEQILTKKVPQKALKEENGRMILNPKLDQLLNPTLSFNDKKQFIGTMNFLTFEEQVSTIEGINESINEYVQNKSFELFKLLGANSKIYNNYLIAAGDGSTTSGMLEEREKDEKGRWNKGLPKAIGFFPYQIQSKTEKGKNEMKPMMFATLDCKTVGGNKITNIHADVWGYNDQKQTTVVIEKNGLSYHLFGAGDTRFLSPDSSFSKGSTFQGIINTLEKKDIGKIDEMIHGKKGFDYWIEYNTKKRDETEMKIEKIEKNKFLDFGYTNVTTNKKASRQVKKQKRKNRKAGINQPVDYKPTTNSKAKNRKKNQQTIVDLYGEYEMYKKRLAEVIKEKQNAIDQRAILQRRLDDYRQAMGFKWVNYKEIKDGYYLFEDSSTFDLYTQEFRFPASDKIEDFEIRLLAIPTSSMSDLADEVMLHVNITDAKPNFDAKISLELEDVFESDKYSLNQQLFQHSDSLAIRELFEIALLKEFPINFIVRAQGIGQWNGVQVVDDIESKEIPSYPGANAKEKAISKMDSTFKRLRVSEVFIHLNRGLIFEINSFTDPVVSNISIKDPFVIKKMKDYKLSKNQILSAYRCKTVLLKLKEEMNVLAGTYFSKEEAKIIIDRLNKEIQKTRISVGSTSFEIDELK
jgi:hypothetical protein